MLLPPKKSKRLHTANFLRVSSRAARSIDFDAGKGVIEIEFINGEVYHYYKAPRQLWDEILELIAAGDSLGTYLNQRFKAEVARMDIDYRIIS